MPGEARVTSMTSDLVLVTNVGVVPTFSIVRFVVLIKSNKDLPLLFISVLPQSL